jgi:fatty acid desaturase
MKRNWFQRHPNLTFLFAYGGVFLSFEKTLSRTFSEPNWVEGLVIVCAAILLMMWLLTLKARSFWWLLLVVPVPVAYLFLKSNFELPKNIKEGALDEYDSHSKPEGGGR